MRNMQAICKQGRQVRVVSLAKETKDDNHDQDDCIYAVHSIAVM